MVNPDCSGHRERLRERFARGGAAALHDYEVLELILTWAIPRRDVKPIAKQLLKQFGSLGAVLSASHERLCSVKGVGGSAALLVNCVHAAASWSLRERFEKAPVMSARTDVEQYLRFTFGSLPGEYVAALYVDTAHKVRSAEVIAEGTVNQCVVYPREVFRKALEAGAAGVILAHNHPGGTLSPSEADWLLTERLHHAGKLMDIPLIDHVIVCQESAQSLRELPRWPR